MIVRAREPSRALRERVQRVSISLFIAAFAMLVAGAISDNRGRKSIIVVSLGATGLVGLVGSLAPSFEALLVARTIASGWVGAQAGRDAAPASALYLLFYYLGSSLAGTAGGVLYAHFG